MKNSQLILVHEPEKACFDRLVAEGFATEHAAEVASYLAQSTDLSRDFREIEDACADQYISFTPVELDHAYGVLANADPQTSLVWTLTDGIAYFRGSVAPAMARLMGLRTIGVDDTLFALCQDKFRSGAVLAALGLPAPAAGLARNGEWLVEPPSSRKGWFVKPNRLGAKIGIWPQSHCTSHDEALDLSRRVHAAYRDTVIVQPYVSGRNVRASFLGLEPGTGTEALGVMFVDSGGDFQTMADSLALYGETGEAAKAEGVYAEPKLDPVGATQPTASTRIREIAGTLMRALGLRDVYSLDFRVEADDTVHLIEFEVCPGLPCFDFRSYCRSQWRMGLPQAMAATARTRFSGSETAVGGKRQKWSS